jgi:transcriptional regulator with XRE-family HTH domain
MPKKISSTLISDLVDLARGGSATAVLLLCAINRGSTLSEIAGLAGVTRQAVSNWARGAEGQYENLKRVIQHLEIDFLEIEHVLSQVFPKTQGYEPYLIKLNVIYDSLTARLEEMHKAAISKEPWEPDEVNDSLFREGFLLKNLKTLFYLAFNNKARGFDLAVIRGVSCTEEAWANFCIEHVDGLSGRIKADSPLRGSIFRSRAGRWADDSLTLSDVCSSYFKIRLEFDKVCKGLDFAPASSGRVESEIFIDHVLWERYDYDRANHINYFFTGCPIGMDKSL